MSSVVIKSNKYGITLLLDDEIDFETLITDICKKFAAAKDFFGKAELVLELQGREVSSFELSIIIEAIELNSDITIALVNEENDLYDKRMKDKIDKFYYESVFDNAKIIKGNVGKDEVIESDSGILVMGDVKQGAFLKAAGNIVVMGLLEGSVYAGCQGNEKAFVVANEINTDQIQISKYNGDIIYQEKWYQRTFKRNVLPTVVVVWEKELLAEPMTSGILKQL